MRSLGPAFYRESLCVIQLPGYMGLIISVAAIYFQEYLALIPFLGISVITLLPSWFILKKSKISNKGEEINHPAVFASLNYGLISVIGAIPLYITAIVFNINGLANPELMSLHSPLNALFESFAGFTSSGLTMIENPEQIPYSIQLWRSLSQWLGGLGIIVLAVFIFTPKTEGIGNIIQTEVGKVGVEENALKAARIIGYIYLSFTLLAFLLYVLVNEPVWISINHALTSVSTGGFNVTNESFEYRSLASKIVSLIMMIIGALGFGFYRQLIVERSYKTIFKFKENLCFLIILLTGIGFLLLESRFFVAAPAWIDNIYQWISALTTSGYQTADLENWGDGKVFLLSLAMLIGGVAGSTAGGLKVKRLLLLINIILFNLTGKKNQKYEKRIQSFGEGNNQKEILFNFITLFGLWLSVLSASILSVSFIVSGQYDLVEVIFEVISAQSNVGLSTGLTGADSHWFIKLDFMLLMWVGRLELIAVIMLFTGLLKKEV